MSIQGNSISDAIKLDSKWTPKILVNIAPPSFDNKTCKEETKTDIVPFMEKPDEEKKCMYKSCDYPDGCSFRFDGYNGKSDCDKLRKYIIQQAKVSSATDLVKGRSNKDVSGDIVDSFCLQCKHYRISGCKERHFHDEKCQQPGTYVMQEHSTKSVKGFSRCRTKKLTPCLDGAVPEKKSNKKNTPRPTSAKDQCRFALHVICHSKDQKWYLRYCGYKTIKATCYHTNHLPLCPDNDTISPKHLPFHVEELIHNCFKEGIKIAQIIGLVHKSTGFVLSEDALYKMRDNHLFPVIKEVLNQPYGTAVDQLITVMKKKKDVNFVYVTHNMNSGFVTYKSNHVEDVEDKKVIRK